MKRLFLILFLTAAFTVTAQISESGEVNPDGTSPSIHFSNWQYKFDNLKVENKFNFEVKAKVPVSYYLTISAFYQQNNYERGTIIPAETNYKKYGFTVSYYFNHLWNELELGMD